jgi:hypothetical protein
MRHVQDEIEPSEGWRLPYARAWNIALRTAHLAVSGVLVGGHVFDVPATRLAPWLYATIITGAILVLIEAFPRVRWCYQGRGALVGVKLMLLGLIPWLWDYRVPILFGVIVIASVGSHMPARFRYYSVLHQRVLD